MRRLLRMSWDDWRALPWYEQRALREGMVREMNPQAPETPQMQEPSTPEEEAALLASAGFTIT